MADNRERLGHDCNCFARGQHCWAQWYTARWKLALDLGHRRSIYTDILKCIGQVLREGRSDTEVLIEYARAADRAEFLFGSDVTIYIASLRQTLNNIALSNSMLRAENDTPEQRQTFAELHANSMRQLAEAYQTLIGLMGPYMKLDKKRPQPFQSAWTFLACKARQLWTRLRALKLR
jgi:hypothetical protein